jgi:hypothetical protein
LLRRVALVRTNVSEKPGASFIRVTKIGELGTTHAATSNRRTLRRNTWYFLRQVPPKRRFLQEPHGVTSQKTPFFINRSSFRNVCFLVFRITDDWHSPDPQKFWMFFLFRWYSSIPTWSSSTAEVPSFLVIISCRTSARRRRAISRPRRHTTAAWRELIGIRLLNAAKLPPPPPHSLIHTHSDTNLRVGMNSYNWLVTFSDKAALRTSMFFQVIDILHILTMYFNIANLISKFQRWLLNYCCVWASFCLFIYLIRPGDGFCDRCWPWNSGYPYK